MDNMENEALQDKILELKNENNEINSSDLLDFAERHDLQNEMDLIYETVRQVGVKIAFDNENEEEKEQDSEENSDEDAARHKGERRKQEGPKEISLLEQYLIDCSAYKCLTQERTTELFHKMRTGSSYARELLINSNLRLVISIAKRYDRHGIDIMDLIQEGNIGLMEAIRKFNPDRGYKLSTYAGFWIKMRIEKTIKEKSQNIRIPAKIIERLGRIAKAKAMFESENKREPTAKELSEITGFSVLTIERSEVIPICDASLDQPVDDDPQDDSLMNTIIKDDENAPETLIENKQQTQTVLNALRKLPERERYILINNFGIGTEAISMAKIGKEIGLTRERVRQIRNDALTMLQDSIDWSLLSDEDSNFLTKIA